MDGVADVALLVVEKVIQTRNVGVHRGICGDFAAAEIELHRLELRHVEDHESRLDVIVVVLHVHIVERLVQLHEHFLEALEQLHHLE